MPDTAGAELDALRLDPGDDDQRDERDDENRERAHAQNESFMAPLNAVASHSNTPPAPMTAPSKSHTNLMGILFVDIWRVEF